MTARTLTVVSTALLALVAVSAQAQTAATQASSSAMSSAKLAHQDAAFLRNASEANNAEVAAGKLALAQSQSADVKTFAQMMVDDHSKAEDELKALASQKGVKVSDKPSMMERTETKILSERKGSSFDQHYAESDGVKAHADAIKLFQKEADKGQDADVKAWAAKMLPALQKHQQAANELKTKADAEPKS